MYVLLLSATYLSGAVALARALVAPVIFSRASSNDTIICNFNGSDYSLLSHATGNVTCGSVMRDAAAAMDISSNERTVSDIVWSCLATIFACTWISVHPNIPGPRMTGDWRVRRHRAFLMLCGIIAPECIVLWALRQWMSARYVVEKMKAGRVHGFTMVHGYFLRMGGFVKKDTIRGVIVVNDHHELPRFKMPTASEIRDKSKGDGLAKALVVCQTAWFVAQCASRWAAQLALTEAELVTLAFAALNGLIYFLWWNKPQDVLHPIQIEPYQRIAPDLPPQQNELIQSPSRSATSLCSKPSMLDMGTTSIQSLPVSEWPRVQAMDDFSNIQTLVQRFIRPYIDYDYDGMLDHQGPAVAPSGFLPQDSYAATAVASFVGVIFGAVHCVAWNFDFHTPVERTLWRAWSAIITTVPIILWIRSTITYIYLYRANRELNIDEVIGVLRRGRRRRHLLPLVKLINSIGVCATIFLIPFYGVARLGLLIQAGVALRDLTTRERAQVQWVNLIPHF